MTTVYLVRHGETDLNREKVIQSMKNTHLNTNSVNKVKVLRETICDLGCDICYTSPLFRTLETAFGLVADKCLIVNDNRLIDRDMGEFEGKSSDDFDHIKYWDYKLDSGDRGVEKLSSIINRCQDFLDDVLEKNKDKKILIVSHKGPIRIMHHLLNKTDFENEELRFEVPNCYFEKIDVI